MSNDLSVPLEERQDAPAEVDKKAKALAGKIRKSEHFIVFTGAGISTSAGIPDFRGPEGNWTLRAQGWSRAPEAAAVSTLTAVPTRAHMALVALQDAGLLRYLVSQNCDGLHRRSGIAPDRISELHGNSNIEVCSAPACGAEYLRDFRAVAAYDKSQFDHRTHRQCARPGCGAPLLDTIVNFGEFLPEAPLEAAREHGVKADLCFVLGSSLLIPPANEIPDTVGSKNRKQATLAICNLQDTPLDDKCSKAMRIYTRSDDLLERVMENLGIEIPDFILRRRLLLEVQGSADKGRVVVKGVDADGTPASFLKSVKVKGMRSPVKDEPFLVHLRDRLEPGSSLELELEFHGHYAEPNLNLSHEAEVGVEVFYLLEYNPRTGEWKMKREDGVSFRGPGVSNKRSEQPPNLEDSI